MTIKLYSYFRSSCSWRVRTVLHHLKIQHEVIPINLLKNEQNSAAYKKVNPLSTVPAIDDNGAIIWQSLAIIDYLDSQNQLLPEPPLERARCMQIVQTICAEIQPLQNLSVLGRIQAIAGDTAKQEWAVHHNQSKLKIIDQNLVSEESTYCVGDKVTLADICLVPQLYSAKRFGIDVGKEFPTLFKIAKRLEKLDAFKKAHPHAQADCPEDVAKLGLYF